MIHRGVRPSSEEKGWLRERRQPFHNQVASPLLERQFQVELHLTRIKRSTGLTKVREAHVVIGAATYRGQQEVGAVEHVECLPLKLQVYALCNLEHLGQRHVGIPLAGAYKLIPAQAARTTQ